MNLTIRETTKWCAVERDENPSPAKIRRAILREENVCSDFSIIDVPATPRDQTVFKVCGNDRVILIGIALLDAVPQRIAYQKLPFKDSAEIYFDLRGDHVGWFRFGFSPDENEGESKIDATTFLPYPEAHSSNFPLLHVQKHETVTEYFPSGGRYAWRCRWIYAWFDRAEIFRQSSVCGFQICRWRPDTHEFNAWNFTSGNGGPDATSFGHLHSSVPTHQLFDVAADLDGSTLHLRGSLNTTGRLTWEIHTPLGTCLETAAKINKGKWSASITLPDVEPGRYRLVPRVDDLIEPSEYSFDLLPQEKPRDFCVSVTWDWPDDLMANYYTPERLDAEMKVMAGWGVNRLHWIDYSNAPSFWAMDYWDRTYKLTRRHCGDVLKCAVQQAHQNNLEIITDFKIFDLAINTFYHDNHKSTVPELGGRRSAAIPEIVEHPEWMLQSNSAWRSTAPTAITCLRFYSRKPLPEIEASKIGLRISKDNRNYKKYRGPVKIRQGKLRRPHQRWTPAGSERIEGSETNWFIELSGLQVKEPFAALDIAGDELSLVHHGFMVAEASDANGNVAPLTVATTGHRDFRDSGYFFWKEWPGWNNYTEPILQERTWRLNNFGLTFQVPENIPSLLEPSYEGTRAIWLNRISQMLEAGVDGVCIRILNHHNGIMSWLQYAFAPVVVETFESRYGRAPQTTPEDYEAVRRIRGEYFTQFLRDAKTLTSARGKKFMVQLESIEVPPHLDTRMQIFLDYQTWLGENIVDEVLLKDWTAQSPWIHEHVLPLARRRNIPVHIISRTLNNGLDHWAMETMPRLLSDAYRAGFSGFDLYEVANLVELNPEGTPVAKGYSTPAITRACRELRALQNQL